MVVEMVQNGDNGIPIPDYADENVSDKVVNNYPVLCRLMII